MKSCDRETAQILEPKRRPLYKKGRDRKNRLIDCLDRKNGKKKVNYRLFQESIKAVFDCNTCHCAQCTLKMGTRNTKLDFVY